ncbi:MAG: T9SS type A sorting domain-containing protein [Tenacibaculum sp.]
MKQKYFSKFLLLISLAFSIQTNSQTIIDDFTDGNFTSEQTWSGSTGGFSVITASTLPSGNASTDGSYLASNTTQGDVSLAFASTETSEWRFSLGSPNFNPSNSNFIGVVLMANSSFSGDLINDNTTNNFQGYYLRIGDSASDAIELWRKTGSGESLVGEFPSSPSFSTGALQEGLNIRVTRSSTGVFELFYSTGFEYNSLPTKSAGTLTNDTYSTSSYFGIFQNIGSQSDSRRIYIDNIQLGTVTWDGSENSSWTTAENWNTNSVPTDNDNIIIPSALSSYPTINNSVTINSIIIESGASLIANAAVTGNVTYKRSLTNTNWYLISPPVTGQTNNDLIEKNNLASGSGGNLGIGTYNNNGATAWSYLNASSTGSIDDGTGKSVKLGAAGDITFTGSLNNTSINKAITTGDRNNYNLVGNPFTSYVNLGTFLTENNTPLSEQTVWLWNENTNSYDVKMLGTHATFEIAPGQGFFVSANSDTNISFNATNQSHQNSDTFQRSTNTQVNLYVKEGKNNKKTEIYYIEGTTKGFDNGYDGTVFSGVSSKFSVYSQLVNNNKGKNYAIQSLPLSEMENITIPIGLKVEANKEIEFSSTSMNLPNNIKVYLEDKINNQLIDITENTYKVTLNEAADGIGQFYLRTSSRDLNIPLATSIEDVNIYKSSNNTITVSGLEATNASLKIYSLLGQTVSTQKFSSNGISTLNIPSLTTGVYIVELNSALGKISKKIILK